MARFYEVIYITVLFDKLSLRFALNLVRIPATSSKLRSVTSYLIDSRFLLTGDNKSLTTYEDLQLAEIQTAFQWKLDDNISVCRHVAGALQRDRCTCWNSARILATHVVIPQGGWCDVR